MHSQTHMSYVLLMCTHMTYAIIPHPTHTRYARIPYAHLCTHATYVTYALIKTGRTRPKNPRVRDSNTQVHCNTLRHIAQYCNMLQHTATCHNALHCTHALYHTATHCNTLQHAATHCNTLQRKAVLDIPYVLSTTHIETHCNEQQNTATHRKNPEGTRSWIYPLGS